jgi:hypothetical protein
MVKKGPESPLIGYLIAKDGLHLPPLAEVDILHSMDSTIS